MVKTWGDQIPIIANGNIFSAGDAKHILATTHSDGLMVSRGALGNPWIFREIKENRPQVPELSDWLALVLRHLAYQEEEYGSQLRGILMMRKHLAWYLKGWAESKEERVAVCQVSSYSHAKKLLHDYAEKALQNGHSARSPLSLSLSERFNWDPKWDMDRKVDQDAWSHEVTL